MSKIPVLWASQRVLIKKQFLSDASTLANIYWMIRDARFHKDVRRHYRRAKKEKGRLTALGYDPEVIRLFRLYLANPRCEKRLHRFEQFFNKPEQMTLF